jgi:hypothetical protein
MSRSNLVGRRSNNHTDGGAAVVDEQAKEQ